MSNEFNIEVKSGSSVRLLTAGKYCDRDIVVSGILKGNLTMTEGSFIPTSDVSSYFSIEHNLGQRPNFFVVYAEGEEEELKDPAVFKEYLRSTVYLRRPLISNGTEYVARCLVEFGDSAGNSISSSTVLFSTEMTTASKFQLYCTSTRKLKAGVTYGFICGVIDGL